MVSKTMKPHNKKAQKKELLNANNYSSDDDNHENDQLMGSVYDNFNLSQTRNPNFDDSDRNISIKGFTITTNAGVELFKNSDLTLTFGHRYGLVGPNGKGKTTLLRHIGLRQFQIPSILDVLYCEQEVFTDETPAVQMVLNADKQKIQLETKYKETEKLIEEGDYDAVEKLKSLHMQMQNLGLGSKEAKARSILHGLGFDEEMMERPSKNFSGGWRMRISLARALFMEPSLLLLDEPTNHLDLNAVIWLDMYLSKWKKTLLIVSHDQSFLDNICTDIIHLDNQKLNYYRGNYEKFQKMYSNKQKDLNRKYDKQEKLLKQEKVKGSSKKAAKDNVLKLKQRTETSSKQQQVELIEKPREYTVKFTFPSPDQIHGSILGLYGASFGYVNGQYLFENVDFGLDLTSRVTLVGPNGVGKSTFLKLLCGDLEPIDGTMRKNRNLIIGKYNQHSSDQLNLDSDATTYLCQKYKLQDFEVRKFLGQFGLESKAHTVVMRNLSGGQKSRVAFVDVALARPHIMILDEPTNNLDLESIGALSKSIKEYEGGVIIVSHDERLIRETKCVLYEVKNKNVVEVEGGFDAYRDEIMRKYFADDIKSDDESDGVYSESV